MARAVAVDSYGWFTPADLTKVIEAFHNSGNAQKVVLVGGQALVAWVIFYGIQLPSFDEPYLTQDADFIGSGTQARQIAKKLHGKTTIPAPDDHTPNTAIVEFSGEEGKVLLIDFLDRLIGIETADAKKLAVPVVIGNGLPIAVLHPLLVLKNRCENLLHLQAKRDANGITHASSSSS